MFLALRLLVMVGGEIGEFSARSHVKKRKTVLKESIPIMSFSYDDDIIVPVSKLNLQRADLSRGVCGIHYCKYTPETNTFSFKQFSRCMRD